MHSLVWLYLFVCLFLLSSVGLAKAALEAINGFNLFGNQVIKMCFLFFFNCSFFLENLKKRKQLQELLLQLSGIIFL